MDNKILGLKIKELRGKKGSALGYKYTGDKLAHDLNISRSYLGDIESGRRTPTPELLSKIANVFDVPVSYFNNENPSSNINEEFDEETRAIARDMQKLSNENKDLLKKLIKSMSNAGDEALKK